MNMKACISIIGLVVLASPFSVGEEAKGSDDGDITVTMPNVTVHSEDDHQSTALYVQGFTFYLTGYTPKPQQFAHHMQVYGCTGPVSGGRCQGVQRSITGWVSDGGVENQTVSFPPGVGVKLGKGTLCKYFILEVHYKGLNGKVVQDNSAFVFHYTKQPLPKTTSDIGFHTTGGTLFPGETVHFENACKIRTNGVIHPLYFTTHSHGLGRVASAWKVGKNNVWELIAKSDPKIHAIRRLNTSVTFDDGDIIATRCTSVNTRAVAVEIGGRLQDERCNINIGYWMDNTTTVGTVDCDHLGPPAWSWASNTTFKNIPDLEASTLTCNEVGNYC